MPQRFVACALLAVLSRPALSFDCKTSVHPSPVD